MAHRIIASACNRNLDKIILSAVQRGHATTNLKVRINEFSHRK